MKTRTLIIFGFAVVLALSFAGIAAAQLNQIAVEEKTASVAFTDKPTTGTLTVKIKNIEGGPEEVGQLSWGGKEAIVLGTTKWLAADQYLEIDKDFNRTGWGIQIYTDNCAADADPRFYIVNPSSVNPAGLVATDNKKSVLPLAWRIMGDATSYANLGILEVEDPDEPNMHHLESTDIPGKGYYPWLWIQDASTPDIDRLYTKAFEDGGDYVTIWNENGVHHGEGPFDYYASPSPNYVYIGARFTTATTPRTYKTSKLTLELFWQ